MPTIYFDNLCLLLEHAQTPAQPRQANNNKVRWCLTHSNPATNKQPGDDPKSTKLDGEQAELNEQYASNCRPTNNPTIASSPPFPFQSANMVDFKKESKTWYKCALFFRILRTTSSSRSISIAHFHPLQTSFFPRQRRGKGDERRGGEGRRGLPCLEALSSLDFTKAVTSTTGLSSTADQTGETV